MSNVQTKDRMDGMNGYKAFWRGREVDVYAESSYRAQLKAAVHFKAKKPYEVSVVLCEKNGEMVIHQTNNF